VAVREFDGIDDEVIMAVGALSGVTHGTLAILVKRLSDDSPDTLIGFANSTGDQYQRLTVAWLSAPNNDLLYATTNAAAMNVADKEVGVWRLIVVRKVTGTASPRFSMYRFSTGVWVHSAAATVDNAVAPGAGGAVRFRGIFDPVPHARIAARAYWSNSLPWSADAAGDMAIENAGLHTALQNWVDAAPGALWGFDQATVSTAVADLTGNGADQTSITGTVVVTGDDPPGFDFTLSGGGITGSGTAAAPAAQVSGTGTITVTGTGQADTLAAVTSGQAAVEVAAGGSAVASPAAVSGAATVTAASNGAATAPAAALNGLSSSVVTGSGQLSASHAGVSGTGGLDTPTVTGSGQAQASAATAAGTGTVTVGGSGQAQASAATAAGTGTVTVGGTGQATVAAGHISGAGQSLITGDGQATTRAAVLTGTEGTDVPAVTGSGALTAPGAFVVGTSSVVTAGSGTASAHPPVVAGVGSATVDGNGAIVTPTVIITGAGAVFVTGAGQLLAPPAAAATDMGRYVWPPTAGSISVRGVATGALSVRKVATADVSVR